MAEHRPIEKELAAIIDAAVREAFPGSAAALEGCPIELEIPKERSHGDLSCNVALRLAKGLRKPPMEVAGAVVERVRGAIEAGDARKLVSAVDAKAPGFINLFLSTDFIRDTISEIQRAQARYGAGDVGRGIRMQIEFVSANPTGPLTIAHGRQAAIGDSLARILSFLGYDVKKEYYTNDEGTQMDILGNSIRVRYRELCGAKEDFPADGYQGAYIYDIAKAFRERYGDAHKESRDIAAFREFGLEWILGDIRRDLDEFGVSFDVWYSQKELRKSGKIEEAIALLKSKGYIFEEEGAVWFRSTAFGDDKDRVIVKSDGKYTYLSPDIAYHLEKYRRGFDRIIDIWGPDHHGYIPRMRAAIQALGYGSASLSVLIAQLATLYRGGKVVSMSTRAGQFVTLREVMDEIGKDASRFCFLMRKVSSHLDFDLDVVKSKSMENPVYYIQYAHARIWSILSFAEESGAKASHDPSLLKEPEELDILRTLRQFPMVVAMSGRFLEPYVVLQYLQDLAGAFHSFYTKHRVVGPDAGLTRARLVLVDSVRIVLANGLNLLGVSLPKEM